MDLDPDRRLALAYAPAFARPALEALWRLDVTLGAALAAGREPMVSRIRLAWWREALERLDREAPPPEPVLAALAAHVLPAGMRWALVDLARRSADRGGAQAAFEAARSIADEAAWPPQLRPLGMLSVLARRDAARRVGTWEPQGSPARMLRMLRHRLTGR